MPQKKGQAKRLLHEGPVSGRKSDICDHSLKSCDHKAYFRYFTSRSDPSVHGAVAQYGEPDRVARDDSGKGATRTRKRRLAMHMASR